MKKHFMTFLFFLDSIVKFSKFTTNFSKYIKLHTGNLNMLASFNDLGLYRKSKNIFQLNISPYILCIELFQKEKQ